MLFFSAFRYGNLQPAFPEIAGKTERKLSTLQANEQVLLLTGIASPAPIMQELEKYTSHIDLLAFDDHHNFSQRDIQSIRERFKKLKGEQRLIITTEKDATRLVHHPVMDRELKKYIYILPIEVEILQNQQDIFNQHIIGYVRENTRDGSFSERKDAHKS